MAARDAGRRHSPERVPRLGEALDAAADELEAALQRATALHAEFRRQASADHGWARLDATLSDELRHRRWRALLLAAETLPDLVREEAGQARDRYPELDVTGRRLPRVPGNARPAEVAAWWRSLTVADRGRVVDHLPHWCGRADGLPPLVRHEANLTTLRETIQSRAADLVDELSRDEAAAAADDDFSMDPVGPAATGDAESAPAPDAPPLTEADDPESRDLRGLLKIQALINPDDAHSGLAASLIPASAYAALEEISTPVGERGLYLLDARSHPLRAAFVLGDLRTAHTVILHVPGTTTTVDRRLYREARWLSALRDEAGRCAGEESGGRAGVAVVGWIGYQAPYDIASRRALGETGIRWIVPGEAVDETYAREAAPLLVRCAEGLRTVMNPAARLVASGHSYGGSVCGLALAQSGVFDACLVTGTPGLFTDDVSTLRIPPGRLYAAVATGDLISRLGVFGPDVARLPGVKLLAPVPHLATYPDGGRSWTKLNLGHESYYERGSSLLHDLACAAVGVEPPSRWPSWAS